MKRTPAERQAFMSAAAAHMRANMTRAERHLWDVLAVLDFDPQVTVSGQTKNGGRWNYILDFAWPNNCAPVLAVEVDGSSHDKRKGRDRRRTERLRAEYGITVIRFTNNQVLRHRNEVVVAILDKMEELRDEQ